MKDVKYEIVKAMGYFASFLMHCYIWRMGAQRAGAQKEERNNGL